MIIAWITIHFGRNSRKGGRPPKDSSDVYIMNLTVVVSLFVIMVWLMNDTPDSLMADTTVNARIVSECDRGNSQRRPGPTRGCREIKNVNIAVCLCRYVVV